MSLRFSLSPAFMLIANESRANAIKDSFVFIIIDLYFYAIDGAKITKKSLTLHTDGIK
jgi:hypothetical protein